jgi:hypothetical protein
MVFVGCGARSDTPSEPSVRAGFERELQEHGNGLIRLVRFTKTNGQAGEMMGVKFYQMEYEAEIEALGPCIWGQKTVGFSDRLVVWARPRAEDERASWAEAFEGAKIGKKGERAVIKRRLRFEKTERGWRGQDGQIY